MDRLALPSEDFQIEVRLIGIDATLGGLEVDGLKLDGLDKLEVLKLA